MKNKTIEEAPDQRTLAELKRDLSVLYEISNAMRTTLDLDHILYIILTGVTAHTGLGFNRGVLFLFNEKDQTLDPRMAIGPDSGEDAQRIWHNIQTYHQGLDDLITEEKLSLNINQSSLLKTVKKLRFSIKEESLLSDAFHSGMPIHMDQAGLLNYGNDTFLNIFHTNELILMPLKAKDKVNGLIVADNLYTQKPITENDLKIFTMLANQAGLAIENSRLYEIVRLKSHTDALTSLWNHGYFQDQLLKELSLCEKTKMPLSLLMIDMDNFKNLNDSFGHQFGDEILKQIALILKDCSRDSDYACRYGGEEFSIILSGTAKDQAFTIAERIREKIREQSFISPQNRTSFSVSVSIGVASFPEDAPNKEDLINVADKVMYVAKFGGKNQTITA